MRDEAWPSRWAAVSCRHGRWCGPSAGRTTFGEDAAEHLNDLTCNYLERVYVKAVLRGIAEDLRWYPFACEPDLRDHRGLDGEPYDHGMLRRAAMDLATRGYHRAFDHSTGREHEHPQARWAHGGTPPARGRTPRDPD